MTLSLSPSSLKEAATGMKVMNGYPMKHVGAAIIAIGAAVMPGQSPTPHLQEFGKPTASTTMMGDPGIIAAHIKTAFTYEEPSLTRGLNSGYAGINTTVNSPRLV